MRAHLKTPIAPGSQAALYISSASHSSALVGSPLYSLVSVRAMDVSRYLQGRASSLCGSSEHRALPLRCGVFRDLSVTSSQNPYYSHRQVASLHCKFQMQNR